MRHTTASLIEALTKVYLLNIVTNKIVQVTPLITNFN